MWGPVCSPLLLPCHGPGEHCVDLSSLCSSPAQQSVRLQPARWILHEVVAPAQPPAQLLTLPTMALVFDLSCRAAPLPSPLLLQVALPTTVLVFDLIGLHHAGLHADLDRCLLPCFTSTDTLKLGFQVAGACVQRVGAQAEGWQVAGVRACPAPVYLILIGPSTPTPHQHRGTAPPTPPTLPFPLPPPCSPPLPSCPLPHLPHPPSFPSPTIYLPPHFPIPAGIPAPPSPPQTPSPPIPPNPPTPAPHTLPHNLSKPFPPPPPLSPTLPCRGPVQAHFLLPAPACLPPTPPHPTLPCRGPVQAVVLLPAPACPPPAPSPPPCPAGDLSKLSSSYPLLHAFQKVTAVLDLKDCWAAYVTHIAAQPVSLGR